MSAVMGRDDIAGRVSRAIDAFSDIKVAVIFGSAARGRMIADSDIDLAVAADQPLSLDERLELYSALGLAVPFEIDLVDMQTVSGVILQQALTTGRVLRKDPELYAALIRKMWFNQADMMPLTRMILAQRRRRWMNER